jgi:hypothetical protein
VKFYILITLQWGVNVESVAILLDALEANTALEAEKNMLGINPEHPESCPHRVVLKEVEVDDADLIAIAEKIDEYISRMRM